MNNEEKIGLIRRMRVQIKSRSSYGFCSAWWNSCSLPFIYDIDNIEATMISQIPELEKWKREPSWVDGYWFDSNDFQTRVGILNEIEKELLCTKK